MSLKRSAKMRDSNEPEIIEALLRAGYSVVRLDTPADLLVGKDGRNYLLEVKTAKGKPTPDQVKFQAGWQGQYAIVRSIEDALREVGS